MSVPMADSVDVWQKARKFCKVDYLQLKKKITNPNKGVDRKR